MPEPIDVVEALLFASDTPLEAERIREVLDLGDAAEARALIDALRERYAAADGALTVVEVAGGFRMVTRPEIAPWLLRLAKTRTKARLSRPSLETLAIVAYRQPVSRPEVDALRGVNSDAVLDNLLDRRLVRISGRKEAPGRPFLYETTREFLVAFGLRDLGDLPKVEGELIAPELAAEAPEEAAPAETSGVDGQTEAEQDPLADPDVDDVRLDGRPVGAAEPRHYLLLNKPAGYVTSRHDPEGRAVVTDLVPPGVRLYPVGRLDVDVEGALLLTNDGALTHRLLHPRYGLPRVYEADVSGAVTAGALPRWRAGVELDDGPAVPLDIALLRSGGRESRVRLTFAEGRKHEVKRYCEALGHRVIRLRRVAFGPIALGALPVGAHRPLTRKEVAALQATGRAPAGQTRLRRRKP
jgi:23S rRNA pseudouridine2605 synthase